MDELNKNLKVSVFADSPLCVTTINMLLQQQQLAGVVLGDNNYSFTQELQAWLRQINIPFIQFSPDNTEKVTAALIRWESNLALSFTMEDNFPTQFSALFNDGLYHFHHSPFPAYQGVMSLYWQLRDQRTQTKITLQKANVLAEAPQLTHDIFTSPAIDIHPLDTFQSLEYKITKNIAPMVNQLLEQIQQGNVQLSVTEFTTSIAPAVQENDLKVNWHTMSSEQICALARAGNPHLGGCIVTLGQTALNLLQASPVKYPTYGVSAGTICHTGKSDGVIVATIDGAIKFDILSNADGIFSGSVFCEKSKIEAGMAFI